MTEAEGSTIRGLRAGVLVASVGLALLAGRAGGEETGDAAAPAPPVLTSEMLADQHNIDVGRGIWEEQCTHCHGAKAYPGKAPKLKPTRYKPDFVYSRVAKGFRAMPAWGEIYTPDEIIGVVAYVKSRQFSP